MLPVSDNLCVSCFATSFVMLFVSLLSFDTSFALATPTSRMSI